MSKMFRRCLNKKGMTLIEMILAVSLLTGITLGALSAIMYVLSSNAAQMQIETDRYNARMALLSISREVNTAILEKVDVEVNVEPGIDKLVLTKQGGAKVEFTISSTSGELERTGISALSFVSVEMTGFKVKIVDGRWLELTLTGEHGLKLTTTISLRRTPTSSDLR